MRILAILFSLIALPAAAFERPVPQPQSATAEVWFALASFAMFAALYAVHKMVNRQ